MKSKSESPKSKIFTNETWIMLGICVITFICFSHVLSNEFLYWDDNAFISGNPDIRKFTWINIKSLFTKQYGHWQPLTMVSYAINYYFSKLSPGGYFFTNVLFHVINTALVFLVGKRLLMLFWKGTKPKDVLIISGIVSLWFGIHPMRVESVAWLFERKDVVYAFFYLLALLSYFKFLSAKKMKWLVYTFLLFAASCLSKPMAVVFPTTLILIDYLLYGKFERKSLLQKVPFLIFSVIIGLLFIHIQKGEHGFIYTFSLVDRFLIANYNFLAYIYKLFLPVSLCALYPFPFLPGQPEPFIFFIAPVIALLVVILPLYITYKKNKTYFKVLLFGYVFYFINVATVLQFISDGLAIYSDRYAYMCYIGLFFVIAYFINEVLQKGTSSQKNATQVATILFTVALAYLCYQRTYIWQNTETLLTDIIKQYPEKVAPAYKYLGIYYGKKGRTQEALNCYETLVNKMHEKDADVYCNIGSVYMGMNNYDEALKYLNASIQLDSNIFMSYRNLGILYANKGDYQDAFKNYNKALKIYPVDEGLHNNLSYAHMATGQYTAAIDDYNFLIRLSPDNALYYFNRGVAEYTMKNTDNAITDFEETLNLPVLAENQQYNLRASAAFNLSVIYKEKGDTQKSIFYTTQAQQLGYKMGK